LIFDSITVQFIPFQIKIIHKFFLANEEILNDPNKFQELKDKYINILTSTDMTLEEATTQFENNLNKYKIISTKIIKDMVILDGNYRKNSSILELKNLSSLILQANLDFKYLKSDI